MVAITGVGGWSEKLAGEFMDGRNRRRILGAATAKEAVEFAFREALAKSAVGNA